MIVASPSILPHIVFLGGCFKCGKAGHRSVECNAVGVVFGIVPPYVPHHYAVFVDDDADIGATCFGPRSSWSPRPGVFSDNLVEGVPSVKAIEIVSLQPSAHSSHPSFQASASASSRQPQQASQPPQTIHPTNHPIDPSESSISIRQEDFLEEGRDQCRGNMGCFSPVAPQH